MDEKAEKGPQLVTDHCWVVNSIYPTLQPYFFFPTHANRVAPNNTHTRDTQMLQQSWAFPLPLQENYGNAKSVNVLTFMKKPAECW